MKYVLKKKGRNTSLLLILVMVISMVANILPEGVFSYAEGEGSVTEDVYGEDIPQNDIGLDDEEEVVVPLGVGMMGVLSGEGKFEDVIDDVDFKIATFRGEDKLLDVITGGYIPKIGDEVKLEIEFTLPTNHDYRNGSVLTYDLPPLLANASGSGTLYSDDVPPKVQGSYTVANGKLTVTFGEAIFVEGDGGEQGLKTDFKFDISAKFTALAGGTDLEQKLKLPGQDEITLNFQPVGGKKIENKTALQENPNGENSQWVEWTVNVNTAMDDLGDTGKIFTDTLTNNNHTYDASSLKVTRYELDATGNEILDTVEDVTSNYILTPNTERNSFALNLTGKYAYEIKYKTIPGETVAKSQTLKNQANFDGENSNEASTTIIYGDPITKSVSKSGETATWTIKVNDNRRTMPSGTTVVDTWTSNTNKHEFVGNTVADIFTIEGLDSSKYQITNNTTGFTLTLNDNVSEPFTIKYSTKPKDLVTSSINLSNEVVRNDVDHNDYKSGTIAYYSQNVLTKPNRNNAHINYQEKTIDWTITVNQVRYTMDNLVITDEFVNENLKIIDGTFKVNGQTSGDWILTHTDAVDNSGDGKGGFVLEFKNLVTQPITITYTTEYDVRGQSNLDNYVNKVGIDWKTNNVDYSVPDIQSSVTINTQQKDKGYKTGSYNYEDKEFNWSVGINYNFDTITNAIFTDELDESQIIDKESITVYKLDLSPGTGNEGKADGELSNSNYTLVYAYDEPYKFEIKFNNGAIDNNAYRVTYTSKIRDDYYAPNERTYTVENKARLKGDDYTQAGWEKELTVEHTEKLITKNHNTSQYSGSAKLAWDMKLNWGQSTLSDVVITDEIGLDINGDPNQMIYKDSFKIYEMDFAGTNSTPTKGLEHLPGDGLYDVEFAEDGSSFEVIFTGTIDKAYVIEYETYFLGIPGSELKNTAKLSYNSLSENNVEDEHVFLNSSFTFSGSAFNRKARLIVTKIDKNDNNKKLSGAEFELWTKSGNSKGFLMEKVSTDTDGVYEFKTKVGAVEYYLVETKAPEGYNLESSDYYNNENGKIVDLDDADASGNLKLTVENTEIKQSVIFTKKDSDDFNIKLPGAVFELYDTSNKKITVDSNNEPIGDENNQFTTDSNGQIMVNNLSPGSYYFKEIKPPANYLMPSNVKSSDFTITAGQTEVIERTMTNQRGIGAIIIEKIGTTLEEIGEKVLEGVEFLLTSVDNIINPITYKTDENGKITFDNLPYGKYTLTETETLDGYTLVTKPIEIVLDSDNPNAQVEKTIGNIEKATIVATKKWVDGPTNEPRPTIWFQLWRYTDNKESAELVYNDKTDELRKLENGTTEVRWDNLDQVDTNGETYTYFIKEVDEKGNDFEPENYKKAENGLEVTNSYVSPRNASAKVTKVWAGKQVDKRPTIWYKLYRYTDDIEDMEEVPVSEAPIKEMKNGETEYVWNTLTKTDQKGVDYKFIVKEVDKDGNDYVPNNYKKVEEGLTVTNTLKTYAIGDYTWIDSNRNGIQDQDEEILAGVIVEIYDTTGKKISETTTGENGKYIFDELEAGEYQIKFTLTPEQARRYRFTNQNQGTDTSIDSDADSITGFTKTIILNDDNKNLTLDYDDQDFKATEGIDPTWDAGVIRRSSGGGGGGGIPPEDPEEIEEPEKKDPELPDEEDPELPGKEDPELPGEEDPELPEEPEIKESQDPEDPTEPPVIPKEELPEKDPEKPVREKEDRTPEDTPKIIEIDPGDTPKGIGTPPKNGKVTIDKDGNWNYTPDPGFTGRDRFSIVVTHPDGTEEEIYFDIDVQTPLGGTGEGKGELQSEGRTLPKTGEDSNLALYLLGLLCIGIGIFTRRKKTI